MFQVHNRQSKEKNKFDTKMYLNFSSFRGRTSAGGGGQVSVQKRGQVSDGGDWQHFCRMGGPLVPPGKAPAFISLLEKMLWKYFCFSIIDFWEDFN